MIRRRRTATQSDDEAVGLSGWLYADLILGLAVVFLAIVVFVPRDTDVSALDQAPPTTTVDLAPTVASLEDRVDLLTSESVNFSEQVAELEDQVESLDSEKEGLLEQIAELEDQTAIENLRSSNASLQAEIVDLEKQADALQADRTSIEVEIEGLENANESLREQIEDAVLRASRGVEQDFYCFRIQDAGRSNREDLARQVSERLEGMGLDDREAGIVLTFGVGVTTRIGIPLAKSFNDDVLSHDLLKPVLGGAVLRHFWNGVPDDRGKPDGSVEVNLYLWQEEGQPQASQGRC